MRIHSRQRNLSQIVCGYVLRSKLVYKFTTYILGKMVFVYMLYTYVVTLSIYAKYAVCVVSVIINVIGLCKNYKFATAY